jgi:hypothetical protein
MGERIPRSIQEKVIAKWLHGRPRDKIASELHISGGSVTGIIQSRRSKDCEFDLLRMVALQLQQQNISVESFAPLIRFREQIKAEYFRSGLNLEESEEHIDSLLEALIVYCFNMQMPVPAFGNQVQKLNRIADMLGIALGRLPNHLNLLATEIATTTKELELLRSKKERSLKGYEVTDNVINDILSNGPYMLGAYLDMKTRLRETENERNEYKDKLKKLKFGIRAREIKEARKSLKGVLTSNEMKC